MEPTHDTDYSAATYAEQPVLLPEPPDPKACFSRIGLAIFVLTLAYQGSATMIAEIIYLIAPAATQTWWYSWLVNELSLYGVGLPCMWLILRRVPTAPWNATYRVAGGGSLRKPHFGLGVWMILVVIGAGLMQIGGLISNELMEVLSRLMRYDYVSGLDRLVTESPLWMTYLGTVIVAPLGEELLFRKLLIDRTRRWGDGLSILLSGILFGLFHGNLFQLIYTTLIGWVLAYVYTRSGSYGWCVGLHAVLNFLGGILPTLLQNWIGPENLVSDEALTQYLLTHPVQYLVYELYALLLFGVMLAAVILLICLRKKVKLGDGTSILPRGRRVSAVVCNAGMLLALGAGLLLLLLSLVPVY